MRSVATSSSLSPKSYRSRTLPCASGVMSIPAMERPFSLMARLPLRSNTAQRTPFERRYPSAFRVSDIMAQIRPSNRRFTENGTIPLLFEMAKKYPLTVSRRTISGH